MDQLAFVFTPPGIGHNHPPEAIDPIEGLIARLTASHAELLARFHDLELACGRVPDQLLDEEDAASATDFIAQCRLHLKQARAAHKHEKALFLRAGRAVDAIFKRRCEQLSAALAPTVARLKAHHDCLAAAERQHHEHARTRTECRRALAEQSFEKHRGPAEALHLSTEQHAEAVNQIASAQLEPTHIRGNAGATAFVRRDWSFEVVDLDQVPREYMSLDVPVVRAAITQDGTRHIRGLRIFQTEGLRVRATTSLRSQRAPLVGEPSVEPRKCAYAAKRRSSDQGPPAPRTPNYRGHVRSASDPRLVVPIKPIWGDQKVLRYYRQALASLQPHDAAEIAKFRAENAMIEARLRRKLPHRMEEIDFLYGGSRGSLEAGEGPPK